MTYTIKLNDGKYTITYRHQTGMEFLRHGEPWPAADDLKHVNLIYAMFHRIEELEVAIKAVLDGSIGEPGDVAMHGIRVFQESAWSIPLRRWESTLRRALEQKP